MIAGGAEGRSEGIAAQLARHQVLREHGTPRVTVLAGGLVEDAWRAWATRERKTIVAAARARAADVAAACLRHLAATRDLLDDAARAVAGARGHEDASAVAARWMRLGGAERAAVAANVRGAPLPEPLRALCARLAAGDEHPLAPGRHAATQLLRGLAELVPPAALPAIVARADERATAAEALDELVAVAGAAPSLPLALVVDRRALAAAWTRTGSRAAVALREGLVAAPDRVEARAAPSASVAARPRSDDLERARRRLVAGGASGGVLARFDDAVAARARAIAAGTDRADDAGERARSAAERLLFEHLESQPRTRGLFRLNVRMPFEFGGRPAEIDLYADSRQLAVEVDGYYHFTDAEAYRRDRRKDLLVQMHGLRVVRVLADDVLARLDDVDAFLRSALES